MGLFDTIKNAVSGGAGTVQDKAAGAAKAATGGLSDLMEQFVSKLPEPVQSKAKEIVAQHGDKIDVAKLTEELKKKGFDVNNLGDLADKAKGMLPKMGQ
jgi:hypothetical protein